MGFRRVIQGMGWGSVFGHGRVFGIHNPFDEPVRKASDPFINLRTLARLSHSPDKAVRANVVSNLASRMNDADTMKRLQRFDRKAVVDALSSAESASESQVLKSFILSAGAPELAKMAGSRSTTVLLYVLENHRTSLKIRKDVFDRLPRSTMLQIALQHENVFARMDPYLALQAFYHLDQGKMTSEELDVLSGSANIMVLEKVAAHPLSSATAIATVVNVLVQKSEKIVDVPSKIIGYEQISLEEYAAKGGDPARGPCDLTGDPIYSEEISHYEYGASNIRSAESLLAACDTSRRRCVVMELHALNPELAGLLESQP